MFALIQDICQFFRRVTRQGKAVGPERLNDKEVARLVKRAAMAAGVRGDFSEIERALKFPATHYALASLLLPKSMSDMSRSNWGMRPRR
jgi:hypothetical protein